jgi:hypothetical protein
MNPCGRRDEALLGLRRCPALPAFAGAGAASVGAQSRILAPLGMKDSFFFPPEDKKSRIAMVYAPDKEKKLTLNAASR